MAGGHSPKSNRTVSFHIASTFKGPDFSICVNLILMKKNILKLYNKNKTPESEEKVYGLPFLSYFPGRY